MLMIRAMVMVVVGVAAQLCYDHEIIAEEGWDLTSFVTWTSVLISFLMAFRLNFAYAKWEQPLRRRLTCPPRRASS